MGGDDTPAGGPTVDDETGEELTPGIVFELFAEKRTRFLLYLLYDRGGTTTLEELAERLAAWDRGMAIEELPAEAIEQVRTTLHHATFPKLADYGLVTHDRDTGAVTLTRRGDRLEPYLEFAREREAEPVETFLECSQRSAR